jgi:alkylhydroperoxidase/carboxymuconolactone decarboxylase family protein YurZ
MHRGIAQLHGATDEELSEVAYLASLTARWSTMIHAQNYDYGTFAKEVDHIGKHLSKTYKK